MSLGCRDAHRPEPSCPLPSRSSPTAGSRPAGSGRVCSRSTIDGLPDALDGVQDRTPIRLPPRRTALAREPCERKRPRGGLVSAVPDLVCITGDLVSHPRGVPRLEALLVDLECPFVVLGNHDVAVTRDPFSTGRRGSRPRARETSRGRDSVPRCARVTRRSGWSRPVDLSSEAGPAARTGLIRGRRFVCSSAISRASPNRFRAHRSI